jgi:hypothetical protein
MSDYHEELSVAAESSARFNGLAVASFVFGITGVGFAFAIIFGHIAKRQLRHTSERGDLLASIGLGLGYVFVVGLAMLALFYLIGAVAIWLR